MEKQPELGQWLDAVRTITQTVATAQPLPDVLDLIAETAVTLMEYDFCGVLLPDPAREKLTIKGWSGLSSEYVARINADRPVRLDQDPFFEAPSSTAFREGRAVSISDIAAAPQFAPWGGVAREQGYRSMISVPLIESATSVIGTLNCYRAGAHSFSGPEIRLLTMLADQAAIALTTARLRDSEARRINELEILNHELHEQRDLLEKSEEIHHKFTEIALRGGGISGIATALSILISRPISIEDAHGTTIGHSAGATDVPQTDGYRMHPVLLSESEVAKIWVGEREASLTPLEKRAIEHASVVTSLEILRIRTADEVQWRLHGAVLNDLLSGEASAMSTVVERAQRLGHDLSVPHTIIAISLTPTAPAEMNTSLQQALRRISSFIRERTPLPLAAVHHDRIVILFPTFLAPTPNDISQVSERIRTLAGSTRPRAVATAAVTGPCTLESYAKGYRSTAGALDMLAMAGRVGTTLSLDDLGLVGLLLQLDDTDQLSRYADRTLGPIRSHDERRGTNLIETLRTYFAHDLDAGNTARALHVHPNTVAQRLRRVRALTGLDLNHPPQSMEIAVALTLYEIVQTR